MSACTALRHPAVNGFRRKTQEVGRFPINVRHVEHGYIAFVEALHTILLIFHASDMAVWAL